MLRRKYATRILGPCTVPTLPFEGRAALIGCLTSSGFRELEVWRRLCDAELRLPYHVGSASFAELGAITPPSRQESLCRLEGDWSSVLDGAGVFGLIGSGETAETLMLGSPTEEAWEAFLELSSGT